jgi:hypothetical protein
MQTSGFPKYKYNLFFFFFPIVSPYRFVKLPPMTDLNTIVETMRLQVQAAQKAATDKLERSVKTLKADLKEATEEAQTATKALEKARAELKACRAERDSYKTELEGQRLDAHSLIETLTLRTEELEETKRHLAAAVTTNKRKRAVMDDYEDEDFDSVSLSRRVAARSRTAPPPSPPPSSDTSSKEDEDCMIINVPAPAAAEPEHTVVDEDSDLVITGSKTLPPTLPHTRSMCPVNTFVDPRSYGYTELCTTFVGNSKRCDFCWCEICGERCAFWSEDQGGHCNIPPNFFNSDLHPVYPEQEYFQRLSLSHTKDEMDALALALWVRYTRSSFTSTLPPIFGNPWMVTAPVRQRFSTLDSICEPRSAVIYMSQKPSWITDFDFASKVAETALRCVDFEHKYPLVLVERLRNEAAVACRITDHITSRLWFQLTTKVIPDGLVYGFTDLWVQWLKDVRRLSVWCDKLRQTATCTAWRNEMVHTLRKKITRDVPTRRKLEKDLNNISNCF